MKNRGEKPVFLRPRAPAFWAYKKPSGPLKNRKKIARILNGVLHYLVVSDWGCGVG